MKDLILLKKLYLIERRFREEYKVISFILNYCHKELFNCNLKYEIDYYGNLFITKNTTNPKSYACVVAHMDCVQRYTMSRKITIGGDIISAVYADGNSAGLSADDSNGIWVALKLLKDIDNLKVVFTCEEESGGQGADAASENIDFFLDVMFLIQADRRGNSDLITHTNGFETASPKFVERIKPISDKYQYKSNIGTFTDIGILAGELEISGVNISCGYYNEHTDREYTNFLELQNCYEYIKEIITSLKDENEIYTITVPKQILHSPTYIPAPIEYDYEIPCDTCTTWDCLRCPYK